MQELIKALTKAQSEFPIIKKNRESYNYDYADLAAIVEGTRAICTKNGLCHVFTINFEPTGGHSLITTLYHSSGDKIESTYPLGDLRSMKDQDAGKKISYAKRYALKAILGVEEEKDPTDDGWGSGNDKAKAPQKAEVKKPAPKNHAPQSNKVTAANLTLLFKYAGETLDLSSDDFVKLCLALYKVKSPRDLTKEQAQNLNDRIKDEGIDLLKYLGGEK